MKIFGSHFGSHFGSRRLNQLGKWKMLHFERHAIRLKTMRFINRKSPKLKMKLFGSELMTR